MLTSLYVVHFFQIAIKTETTSLLSVNLFFPKSYQNGKSYIPEWKKSISRVENNGY